MWFERLASLGCGLSSSCLRRALSAGVVARSHFGCFRWGKRSAVILRLATVATRMRCVFGSPVEPRSGSQEQGGRCQLVRRSTVRYSGRPVDCRTRLVLWAGTFTACRAESLKLAVGPDERRGAWRPPLKNGGLCASVEPSARNSPNCKGLAGSRGRSWVSIAEAVLERRSVPAPVVTQIHEQEASNCAAGFRVAAQGVARDLGLVL